MIVPQEAGATNTQKVIQFCGFLPSKLLHPWPGPLSDATAYVTDATRLLENHLTDAISFNSAISACEKRLDQRDGQPVSQDVMEM